MITVYDILTDQDVYLNPSQVIYVSCLGINDKGYNTFEVCLTNNNYMRVYTASFMAIKEELDKCQQ